ncbi:MAG: hypothetical protein M3371_15425, partial [Acidobacteriota bacterium]|nr:hypothetical protein [Acidobacteriota bacterium]
MSKLKNSLWRASALVLALSLAWISMVSGVQAQAVASPPAAVNAKSAGVTAATAEVLQETSRIRQLGVLRAVKSGTQTRTEIEGMLVRNLDEDSTPAELRASQLALIKLGLAPANFQLREFIIKLLTEQVAGYYDPKTQIFYLADWIDLDGQKPVIAHELTHALQDQHFNLRRFEKWPTGDSDAELAAHALVEGDAMLTMMQYVLRNPAIALGMLKALGGSGASATEQLDRAPRVLRETLMFPYTQGMTFATQVQRRGGWPLVSAAYKDLPQSTEQILHPEKYFAREAPLKVELAVIARALGNGWQRLDFDVNGEWSYYLILDEFLKSPAASREAAAGWGGDRYAVYENAKTGAVVVAQQTVWD